MTITNPALNIPYAAEQAAQAARVQVLERSNAEAIGERLRKATSETPFASGTTVTARYRYKVAADGSFIPLQTQITTDEIDEAKAIKADGRRSRQTLRQNAREDAPSFRDYASLKPQLSPSDEAAIFSSLTSTLPNFGVAGYTPKIPLRINTNIGVTEAQDEYGNPVQAEVISSDTSTSGENQGTSYSASFRRAQASVATLYARATEFISQSPDINFQLAA